MAEIKTKSKKNFTSYLDSEALNGSEQVILNPKLLSGELEVARARNVLLFSPTSKIKDDNGIPGVLVITNFKLSFLSFDDSDASSVYQDNVFLGKNDVTLSNIDIIYQINDRKKRLVAPNVKILSKLDVLHIICKNFRVFKFGFKRSEVGKGKHIAEALAKFAFPNRHNLLFSYNYKENYYNILRNVPMFNKKVDWSHELLRCGATGWRVLSREREDNIPERTLPMHYVIPKTVTEIEYIKLAESFNRSRAAIWVYSLENASLVRMAELIPTITDTKPENKMLELVRKCDPTMKQPSIMELNKVLPSILEVQASFLKLRELCTPDCSRQFMVQDVRFYTLLDKSCWLFYVSLCLKYSNEAATKMRNRETVVLQESEGRDMCCVISSLTQILLDPYYRTLNGFQALIQKDWVSLGHPFSDRLGHVINSDTTEQSPLFLLFLDCTWQLIQQFPEEFEYSETFLTTIWDSAFLPLFDTFQFNSEHDRQYAHKNEQLILRPVWDWGEQFSDKDMVLFANPLFKKPPEQSRKSMAFLPPTAIPLPGLHQTGSRMTMHVPQTTAVASQLPEERFLEPQTTIRDLELWTQCYFRWQPLLEIKNGGYPQVELYNRIILSNISKLQQALQSNDIDDLPIPLNESDDVINGVNVNGPTMPSISSFFPFSGNNSNSNELTDILTQSYDLLTDGSIMDGLSISQIPD